MLTAVFAWWSACSSAPPPPAPAPGAGPASRQEEPAPPPRNTPPNVLVVILDDVGVDRIAAYGETTDVTPTPTLSSLAREGVLFRNAWAYPYCSATRAALQTGRYAARTGIGYVVGTEREGHELTPEEVTIPEMLANASTKWDTSLVGKWHLGSARSGPTETHPGRQGFAWYASTVENLHGPNGYYRWTRDLNGVLGEADGYATTVQADDAITRTKQMTEPWFLTLAFNAAHAPLHLPPVALAGKLPPNASPAEVYDAMLRAADAELGRVLASMPPGVRERTMVFVIGDNGTMQAGVRAPQNPDAAKGTVYEGGVNVPFLVAGPLVTHGESDALVHAVDLFPTVAAIAGVDPRSMPNPLDGRSLLPVLKDPAVEVHRWLVTEQFGPNGPLAARNHYDRAIRGLRYKLVVSERDGKRVEQLFDLQGRTDDGPNLLADGSLSEAERQALDDLRAELDRQAPGLGRSPTERRGEADGRGKVGGPAKGKARKGR